MFFPLNCADVIVDSETDDTSQSSDADVDAYDLSDAESNQESEHPDRCVSFATDCLAARHEGIDFVSIVF